MAPALRPAPAPQSSRPVRSSRKAVKDYREESTDDEQDQNTLAPPVQRPRRSSLQPPFWSSDSAALSSDNNDSGSDHAEGGHVNHKQLPSSKPLTRSKRPPPSTKSSKSSKNLSSRKRRHVQQGATKGKQNDVTPALPEDSGDIPPWQNLPYLILFDIFIRASQPLYDRGFVSRRPSIHWLLDISCLCRSFHEPAMAALYYSPPLFPASRCHGLLNLLEMPQENLTTNYRCLIKQLDVDVPQLLFYKNGPSLGYFDLGKLLQLTPQLRYLNLYHRDDLILNTDGRFLPVTASRWSYPSDIFDTLEGSNIRLRSWDWNARLLESSTLLGLMGEIHLRSVFHDVQELRFLNISGDKAEDDEQVSQHVLAFALSSLPKLRSLHFERCSIVSDTLLANLPTELQTLSITNCTEVTSDNLGVFLSSHGRALRELFLAQNRHLNLTFMVNLAEWCPQLKALGVDLTFYDPVFHDVEPHFGNLMVDADVPSWPATLQSIELNQLRKWDDKTAGNFFRSLVKAAPNLPDLRSLILKAILKIGWRDRATFRDRWIKRIEDAFLRKSAPPDPNLRSVSSLPKQCPAEQPPGPSEKGEEVQREEPTGALSQEILHSSASPTPRTRKSTRIARQRLSSLSTEQSSQNNDSRRSSESDISRGKMNVQGMCDVVLVRIDNLRPSESQFKEADFLDDELSGDDDWDGTDPVPQDGYAW